MKFHVIADSAHDGHPYLVLAQKGLVHVRQEPVDAFAIGNMVAANKEKVVSMLGVPPCAGQVPSDTFSECSVRFVP